MASSTHTFRSRDEYRKAKELEEARKAGTVAPEVDEEGNDINPHIPQYISRAPWYLNTTAPSLKHQRSLHEKKRESLDKLGTWYARGETTAPAAKKYRKGACENCGAMTHKTKDCLERPRKRGAKLTNADIRPDEKISTVSLDWEGKRDYWNGYDAGEHRRVIEHSDMLEEERKALRARRLEQKLAEGGAASDSDEDDEAGFKLKGDNEVIMQQQNEDTPMTVRNLRIRENTAKYLMNLDTSSAYYDPKTRSMRKDPLPHIDAEDKDYAGDNFVRYSGDVSKLGHLELHALQASEEGRNVPHPQADPSQAEFLFHEYSNKKDGLQTKRQRDIREKYGGEEYTQRDEDALLEQSELYVEYSRDGRVLNGPQPSVPRSKYREDMFVNNHTAVWGSFYERLERSWGYACCMQTVRNSYCVGERGKVARREALLEMEARSKELLRQREERSLDAAQQRRNEEKSNDADEARKREQHVLQSLLRQKDERRNFEADDRKRAYNSLSRDADAKVTDEDMEAYRLSKLRHADPMAEYFAEKEKGAAREDALEGKCNGASRTGKTI